MSHRVAIVGGFDLSNFGDLLFPLIATAELRRRLGDDVEVDAYAYRPMSTDAWPYSVRPVQRLIDDVAAYDALLIGGGLIIHADDQIAAGWVPTDARTHHPLGLWLIPSLTAKLAGVPVAWNAPGVLADLPAVLLPLVALTVETMDYISVRDPSSARRLAAPSSLARIQIVPDTAFDIGLLIPERPSNAYADFCRHIGVDGPYIVLQPSSHVEIAHSHAQPALDAARSRGAVVLELPIGPVNGDRVGRTNLEVDASASEWPDPLLLAEVIARSEAIVGSSLHLSIVAAASGVPVYRPRRDIGHPVGALLGVRRVYEWDPAGAPPAASELWDFGRQPPGPDIAELRAQLEEHWNRIAALIRGDSPGSADSTARLRAELPTAVGSVLNAVMRDPELRDGSGAP